MDAQGKSGGVISGHNYGLNFFGVIEAVNGIIGYDNVSIKSDDTWFYTKRLPIPNTEI